MTKFRAYYKLLGRLEFTEGGFRQMRDPEERPLIDIPLFQEDFYEEIPDISSEFEAV